MIKKVLFVLLTISLLGGCKKKQVPKDIDLSKGWRFAPDEKNLGVGNSYAWGTCEISKDSIILTVKKGTLHVGQVMLENEIVSEFKDVLRIEEGEELKVML
jgi:hypothetical protein